MALLFLMKKFLILVLLAGLVLAIASFWPSLGSKPDLDPVAAAHDPATLEMGPSQDPLVRFAVLADQNHAGFVTLPDGEKVKFWFRSHHLPPGTSYTRFDFSDGSRRYFEGYFCCEVMFPEMSIRSRGDLLAFLEEHEGAMP
jgi:hypothetical protein